MMLLLIGIVIAAASLVMGWLARRSGSARKWIDGGGMLALFVFIVIAASTVMNVILHQEVFMTQVHEVFLNPFWLMSGAYLSPYLISRAGLLLVDTK
ncbi:transposase [Paenibacillus sp. GCM10023252]|uniref:transposase n=1 Tax=Paenibacillus sp. GCM10023252 TaxID=3252649 RepID=UPI003605D492